MNTDKFAEMINECSSVVFFGGAGVSTESGVKDYRSRDGLYNTVKEYGVSPEVILSIDFFESNPEVFYDFYRKYFTSEVNPNRAHAALAELERRGKLKAVITQNIDGLHQRAGSKNVVELHGSARKFYCYSCGKTLNPQRVMEEISAHRLPKCEFCGGIAKPKVVLYGEMLYKGVPEAAMGYISRADMLIVGGTSLAVQPAASFVSCFRGKYTVVINREATDFDSKAELVFHESIGDVFEKTMAKVK